MGTHKSMDAKSADNNIKYCKSCNKCWEIQLMNNFRKRERKLIYYEDFPNYGKIKQLCDDCKKGENNVKNRIHIIPSRKQYER